MDGQPIVAFEGVTKTYLSDGDPVDALNCVTASIPAGRFVALVGRSGCGKSTFLNLAGAMDLPSQGAVRIEGVATSTLNDAQLTLLRREKVGFIFQSFQLLPTLTALENVELPLLLAGRSEAATTARERLEWVELGGLAHRFPHQMSGGQMQRVAIARALAHNPRLLLADEPTGNLDSTTGELTLQLLRRIVDDLGVTILMATHSRESMAYTDTVIEMRDGHIEAEREVKPRKPECAG